MANNKDVSPERELLDLIENEGGGVSLPKARRSMSVFSIGGLRSRLSFTISRIEKAFKTGKINLRGINAVLMATLAILFIYVVIDIGLSVVNLNNNLEAAFALETKPSGLQIKEETYLREAKHYLDKAKKRNIFDMVRKEPPLDQTVEPKIKEVVTKSAHLKLVGISWSNNPDAMIEDTRAQKTFFVKKGDMIGVVEVKEIYQDKIVLMYKGETTELE